LAEDLLEEMEDNSLDSTEIQSKEPLGKKSFIKRLLGAKKRILIILVACAVLIGILAGVWFFFFKRSSEEVNSADGASTTEESRTLNKSDKSDQIEEIVFEDIIELEPFERIALKGGSAMGLISLDVSLELIDHSYRKQVYSMEDRIRKIITGQVRTMGWLELRNPGGKFLLKYDLLQRINSMFPRVMVRNIYFTNLIMQ